MNHLVGGLFGKRAVKAEEFPGHFPVLQVPAVRDVADVGYGPSLLPCPLFAIVGFDDQPPLPPFPMFPLVCAAGVRSPSSSALISHCSIASIKSASSGFWRENLVLCHDEIVC